MPNEDQPKRSIDERLDALTQSLELMASIQRDNERANEQRFSQITHNFEIVLDSIRRLENIALAHEHRLDRIQGEQQ